MHLVMLVCGLWARDTPPTAVPTTSRNVPRKRLHFTGPCSCRTFRWKHLLVAGVRGWRGGDAPCGEAALRRALWLPGRRKELAALAEALQEGGEEEGEDEEQDGE